MRINNLPVAVKLWSVVLGSMAVILSCTFVLTGIAEQRAAVVHQRTLLADQRISLTHQWKSLTELTAERLLVSVTAQPELAQAMGAMAQQGIAQINALQQQVEALADSEPERQLLAEVAAARSQVLGRVTQVYAARDRGELDQPATVTLQQLRPVADAYVTKQQQLLQLQEQLRDQMREQSVQQRQRSYWWVGGLAAVLVLVGLLLARLIVRSITLPLQRAVQMADAIAAGDLTVQAHDARKDELGHLLRSFHAMSVQLREVVGQVRIGVEAVHAAAGEIATGNQDLSSRTEQTASSLQQTAASIEQLTSTVAQSADTSRQANQLATTAVQAAERGGEVVQQVMRSMAQINTSSRKISDIIGVIDGIAFQTNILALNAAVEAARAGEQGRGFAVVAGEVRSLAQRSAEAAKEIKSLITTSVSNVDAGAEQVELAGRSMEEIVHSVRRVTDLIGEITASTAEQRDGIGQVNQAVMQLDQMTQQNAALVEESSAAAMAMNEQAQRLAQVVSVFKVGEAQARYVAAHPHISAAVAGASSQLSAAATASASWLGSARGTAASAPARPVLAPAPSSAAAQAASQPVSKAATTPGAKPAAAVPAAATTAVTATASAEDDWESF